MKYVTTPIYYANGSPHLGHVYTTIIADCYKRFFALTGEEVLLITGTDEHGQKIERAAARAGIPVGEFVSAYSNDFIALWQALDVSFDRFSRTTEAHHQHLVRKFWQQLVLQDDIYLGNYEGLYCVECEQYFTEGENCPVHLRPLEFFSEESYFFRLSRYQQRLIDHIESHQEFIVPDQRRNEVLSFLKKNRLKDLSVSRTSTCWGIPVPNDSKHVIYVWLDALVTYLSSLGDLSDPALLKKWQNSYHFIGKDILIFHSVYWPSLLMSVALPLPKRLFVNGWMTVEGRKISKSDETTIVDPVALVDVIGNDGLRYYLCRSVRMGQDLDFKHDHMVSVLNADLANNLGNLFNRVISLIAKFYPEGFTFNEELPETAREDETHLLCFRDEVAREIHEAMTEANVSKGCRGFIEFSSEINRYLQRLEPWRETDEKSRRRCLWFVYHCLADLTILAHAFVPDIARCARKGLGLEANFNWRDIGRRKARVAVAPMRQLFKRLA